MGIIIRQSLKSTIVSYAGVALGALNTLALFPRFFEADEFGLTRVLLSVAALLAQFAEFGGANAINKFFPFFKNEKEKLRQFVFWILLMSLAAYAIVAFIVYVFKGPILQGYVKNQSTLAIDFYGYVFPIAIFLLTFNLLEAYSRSLLRITVPNLLREVYLRLFLLAIILLYHFDVISFELFIILFAASYGSAMIILAGYVTWLDRNFFMPSLSFARHRMVKEVFVFSLYSLLTYAIGKALYQLDVIMLSYLDSLEGVAVYSIAYYVVTLTMLPQRYLSQISFPILSQHIQDSKWNDVKLLYQRVGLNQFAIGVFLTVGLWVNLENLYYFLPEKYHAISGVVLVLSLGRLYDMATSVCHEIVLLSQHFKFNFWTGVLTVIAGIVTNLVFIPLYGILGAAIAMGLTLLIINTIKIIFIYVKMGFLPFSNKMIAAMFIGILVVAAYYLTPDAGNVYVNLIARSALAVFIFVPLLFWFNISADINDAFRRMTKKLRSRWTFK